jgi:hypothetical protein
LAFLCYFVASFQKINKKTMAAKRKSFDDWTTQEIRDTFNIKVLPNLPLLEDWLSKSFTPDTVATIILEERRLLLNRFFRSWNEDELKFQFIAHITELARLRSDTFNTFSQRMLSALVDNHILYGRPELMVASGQEDPKKPYFFIHEYKPSKRADEPLGQVLAAMVAAQAINKDGQPLFGCIVIGNIWQFLILDKKTYSISRTYDANQVKDLNHIYSALCQSKVYIEAMN